KRHVEIKQNAVRKFGGGVAIMTFAEQAVKKLRTIVHGLQIVSYIDVLDSSSYKILIVEIIIRHQNRKSSLLQGCGITEIKDTPQHPQFQPISTIPGFPLMKFFGKAGFLISHQQPFCAELIQERQHIIYPHKIVTG